MSEKSYTIRAERMIDAPRSVVCRAWTEPGELRQWYKFDDSWATPVVEVDLRVGGVYRFGLNPPGRSLFYEVGVFREVALPDRLVYTLRFQELQNFPVAGVEDYETVITADFHELAGGRTRVAVAHDGYRTKEDRDLHQDGWPGWLEQLAKFCAAKR